MLRSAVILAAGTGRRMWPFATVRNKCAMPVANTPNIRWQVETLRGIGVDRIAIATGHNSPSIRHALQGLDADPRYVTTSPEMGTAGAAREAWRVLDETGPTILLYGDVVMPPDTLRRFTEEWGETGADGAVLYDEVNPVEGGDWHSVVYSAGRLDRIVGHEAGARARWCGAAIVGASFARILESNPGRMLTVPVGGMPPMEPDLAQSLNEWPAEVAAIRADGFVVDMDKPWHVLEANARMAAWLTDRLEEDSLAPTARIEDGADVHGHIVLGEGACIGKRVVVDGNLIVGQNTTITNGAILQGGNVIGDASSVRDYCLVNARAVVGSNCVVGHGAEIDGVMFDGSYLYHYCEISGLVGASVDIGAATVCGTLRFDDGNAEHRVCGRREHPLVEANATYFGDHSRTGVNVITMPGVKIGVYSCVGAGIVVYEDVPDRTLCLLRQDVMTRPWGPERYGW